MNDVSIKTKLTVAMLAICLISIVFVAALSNIGARGIIRQETLDKAKNNVDTGAETINRWLSIQEMLLRTAGNSVVFYDDISQISAYLNFEMENNPHLFNMYVGFADDTAMLAQGHIGPELKITGRAWYIEAMAAEGDIIITAPYEDGLTGLMCITMARYIGQINGLDAVIAVDVAVDVILDIATSLDVAENGYTFLANQDGLIIAHPKEEFNTTGDIAVSMLNDSVYREVFEGISGRSARINTHNDGYFYFIPINIESSGWTLYAAIPESDIYARINEQTLVTLLISAVIMGLSAIIIRIVLMRLVIKPILKLTVAADQIANGNINTNINAKSNDEIGLMLRAFKKVGDTTNMVIDDMGTMSKEHKEGNFEYELDETKYSGGYKTVVAGINSMVNMYTENLSEIMGVLQSVDNGNFHVEIRKYPGKQAIYNEIIEDFKSKLIQINTEISGLAEAASQGNLSARVETLNLEGDWLKMSLGLNNMLDSISKPLDEISSTLTDMAAGNLSARITGDYKGDFAVVKTSMNNMSSEISSYIFEINHVLNQIAENNLSVDIERKYIGDFISIKDSINRIIVRFNDFMKDIDSASKQVSDEARQIADNSSDLAKGTSEQSDSIDELTKTVDMIDEKTKENANSAKSANELSAKSKEHASKANEEMNNMLESIQEIKIASENISKIMKVIEDIAFQTNLLALNAAVEAARAGAYGKGFAVVAEEVRMLAGRSQNATVETSSIIKDSLMKVEVGVVTARSASESLDTIIGEINDISKIVGEISDSSNEQSVAVSQVADGLKQIAGVVMSNSSTSEELASTSKELSNQSEILKNMIDVFKIK